MTEDEWLAATDPTPMWWHVEGTASGRKLRLIACACCRRAWHLLAPRSRAAVEAAEGLADGRLTAEEADRAIRPVGGPDRVPLGLDDFSVARSAVISHPAVTRAVPSLAASLVEHAGGSRADEARAQCDLVRDVIGNPFHPVALDPSWRVPTVVALAKAMYEARDFGAMPVLADALEEAGCDDPGVLDHCRGVHAHVKGCWLIDAVLGKG